LQARADRYTYLPLVGLFVILAWGACDLVLLVQGASARSSLRRDGSSGERDSGPSAPSAPPPPPRIPASEPVSGAHPDLRATTLRARGGVLLGAAAAALAIEAVLARRQLAHWEDSATLYRRAIEVTEDNAIMHYNLADVLAEAGRIDEAIAHYRDAVRIDPDF